ncbi:MAG: hypothetical protein NTW96_07560 [Planctomycetia bacterium]|nr:hypothetical protein [Planctomycetia bacterium]
MEGDELLRGRDWESNPLVWFVEAANSDINWMEPRDIPLEQALVGIDVPGGIQSNYSDGLPAQTLPGLRMRVPANTPPDELRAMFTVAGGKDNAQEAVPPSVDGKRSSPDVEHVPNQAEE